MLAGLIPRLLKKLLKGRMELYLEIESGIFRNRTGDENMNLCGVRLVRRQDVPVSLSFLGRELEAGRVTLAAYHKRNGQLLAYQEEQITDGAVAMVVDFDTQEIRAAARDAEGKTIEAQVAVLVETEEGKGVYHSLPLNFYLEPGLIGDEHLPNSARPAWEMMYETVVKKAEETEGYAGSALASKRAAAASEAAAGTSATNAARDAKSAHAAKTAVESLATTWPETVREGKQQIIEARNEAVTAIQDKQANSVLAVGRAQKTATDKISGAQADAVSAVQAAGKEAQGTITPLVQRVETAKEAIDQAEGRINTAATDAANSATSAANSATAAANALAAIPQVDASGNMTIPGGLTAAGAINANGGINSPSPIATMQSMTTLGAGYAAEAFDLSGYVDLRNIAFANAVNVSKVTYPYLMNKDLVIFREVPAGNNFMSYPLIKFDRYNFAWGTFPPSSMVLSMGGTYMNFEAGEHNAFMGFALGQNSIDAQSVSEVAPPYIYLKMYSRARAQTTFSIYYNTGDGEQVIEKPGRTQSINRLYLIYEQVNNLSARISVGVVYSSSNLGVTSREVTIYSMGEIAVDYYACAEKVIPFFANNTTTPTITSMNRALGLGVYPGMLITDYFSKVI